jgi:hypothetical protein
MVLVREEKSGDIDGIRDKAFMIFILGRPVMKKFAGTARYRDEFNEAI